MFHIRNLHFAHRMYLCASYGSDNKQRLFPQTALPVLSLQHRCNVFPVRYELNLCDSGPSHRTVKRVMGPVEHGTKNSCWQRPAANYPSPNRFKKTSMTVVRDRSISTERPPLVGEVSANFEDKGYHVSNFFFGTKVNREDDRFQEFMQHHGGVLWV
jgi:hypothetical protein